MALEEVSVSQPLAASPSQSPYPPAQRTTAQVPRVHPWVWVCGRAQARSQPPQCAGSMAVSAQRRDVPLAQVIAGATHDAAHTPAPQT